MRQPLPEGPVITIPPGSTNVPVTSASGFEVGEKIGIGYGTTGPAVAKDVEHYEVATVAEVGKPGTQTALAAGAKAGDTAIRVRNVVNISVGDKIRLDIDSKDHGVETVTVTRVGTVGNGGRGGGAELELADPLKFDHAANMPLSVRGTGISFEHAMTSAHSSNEPVQPLGTGITLDSPLASDHEINSVVRDVAVTNAGYQGPPAPNQWFGGPALSPGAGTMVLRDATGLVVDSLNYGLLVDPWAAEGYQAASGAGESGCRVPSPNAGAGGAGRGPAAAATNRSAGRFPDGADSDSNCRDFHMQAASTLPIDSVTGASNIKVTSVADFGAGQTIIIDTGDSRETGVIGTVGTPGGTTVRTATEVGATVIPVASPLGFSTGQTITVDSGANGESAVVASVNGGGRGGPGGRGPGAATITVAAPLTLAHAVDAQVSGSGITLAAALTKAHDRGAPVAGGLPTPGAPNQYYKKPQ